MIARILCRLGLHSWEPEFSDTWIPFGDRKIWVGQQTSCKCRRCGKRVSI